MGYARDYELISYRVPQGTLFVLQKEGSVLDPGDIKRRSRAKKAAADREPAAPDTLRAAADPSAASTAAARPAAEALSAASPVAARTPADGARQGSAATAAGDSAAGSWQQAWQI